MGIFDMAGRWLRAGPWYLFGIVFIAGFLAGGLLDLDHVPRAIGIDVGSFSFGILQGVHNGRLLHGVALIGGGALCACAGGYLYSIVLKDTSNKAIIKLKNMVYNILDTPQ